jgi:hypothetical protein
LCASLKQTTYARPGSGRRKPKRKSSQ